MVYIYIYIWLKFMVNVNVGKYTLHGSYGYAVGAVDIHPLKTNGWAPSLPIVEKLLFQTTISGSMLVFESVGFVFATYSYFVKRLAIRYIHKYNSTCFSQVIHWFSDCRLL